MFLLLCGFSGLFTFFSLSRQQHQKWLTENGSACASFYDLQETHLSIKVIESQPVGMYSKIERAVYRP